MQILMTSPKTALHAPILGLAAGLLVACASQASAGSIDPVATGSDNTTSVVTIGCEACPPLKPAKSKDSYVVRDLEPGTQTVEIREINGKMKVVRTEAWLGGSPVVFITSVPGQDNGATDVAKQAMPPALDAVAGPVPEIDSTTTTSAVNAGMVGKNASEKAVLPNFNPDQLQLRAE
jgi:hypothetical protein